METVGLNEIGAYKEDLAFLTPAERRELERYWPRSERLPSFFEYAKEHHRTFNGDRLNFEGRPWAKRLYGYRDPEMVIMKAVQMTATENLLARAFYLADSGWNGLYVMPRYSDIQTFVTNRVDKCIAYSPRYMTLLQTAVGHADSTLLKHLGKAAIKFVWSNSEAGFAEFPADFVFIDEFDLCDQTNVLQADQRMRSTFRNRVPILWRISKPTLPRRGIHAEFLKTDQRRWHVVCPVCGQEQVLDWFSNVVEKVAGQWELIDRTWRPDFTRDIALYCGLCGEAWLDRAVVILKGNFRPTNLENVQRRGVHLHRLMDIFWPVYKIWLPFSEARGNPSAEQEVYNADLGIPYEASSAGIMESSLNACIDESYVLPADFEAVRQKIGYRGLVTAGIDVGRQWLYVRVSWYPNGKRTMLYLGKVREFEDLPTLFARFRVQCAVIDLNPEVRKVKELQAKCGFLYALEFDTADKSKGFELKVDRVVRLVKGERTMLCDRLHQAYVMGQTVLPRAAASLEGGLYYKHMITPARVEQENARGQRYFIWKERNSGHDDFFFAELYDLTAELINPQPTVRVLGEEPAVPSDPWTSVERW